MTKEEFEALINRYLAGEATARDEQIIDEFFASQERKNSPVDHDVRESMWASIEDRIFPRTAAYGARRSSGIWVRAAAFVSILLIAFLGYTYVDEWFGADQSTPWVTLDTPFGQKSIVTLPDGTRIFLNGGTVVSYPEVFHPDKREVKLSGEAFFEVAADPHHPFVVQTGHVTTEVLGTSFNIQAFPGRDISVTVATGKVQVETGKETEPGSQRVVLKPNEQAVYQSGKTGFTVSEVDLGKYLAWKDNTLLFEDASLEEVARLLERWYNVTIEFDNDVIRNCRINGRYKDQSLERVLQSIAYMYDIEYRFTFPNKVRLNGPGCRTKRLNSS